MELLIAFTVGMVVMDVMWAWRLGIPQAMYYRFKYRNVAKNIEEEQS
jgi:hypothetical protein